MDCILNNLNKTLHILFGNIAQYLCWFKTIHTYTYKIEIDFLTP